MTDAQFESTLLELKRSSKASLIMVVLGAICVLGSLYYSATRLTPLENEISLLTKKTASLKSEVATKQRQLDFLNKKLKDAEENISSSVSALTYLENGTRSLLNRQYSDAIDNFLKFSEMHPSSTEGLNFLGYSELRFAQYWKELSKNSKDESEIDIYKKNANDYFEKARNHLTLASNKNSGNYSWPDYNLSLLYLFQGNDSKAMSKLADLLLKSPSMVKYVCDDGQFRKLRLQKSTSKEFVSILNKTMREQKITSCWVIKAPIKNKQKT